ncbi:MAG: cytochrome c [Devosia marina]|uniref:c-type cytochrome n=1 Tax=Devosia marina TaxID=2683198 RepID=UPI0032EEA898
MNRHISYLGPLACGILLIGAISALGHNGATGIVGERMMGMMMLSEQVKALAPIASSPGQGDEETVIAAAEMIAMHAGPAMTDLFPPDSIEPPSEAKPAIWARWEEFSQLADQLGMLGEELGQAGERLLEPANGMSEAEETVTSGPATEWAAMDFEWLMGLAPQRAANLTSDREAAQSTQSEEAVAIRTVGEIYSDIAATCASCHSQFRR